jgi:hypothetical protein
VGSLKGKGGREQATFKEEQRTTMWPSRGPDQVMGELGRHSGLKMVLYGGVKSATLVNGGTAVEAKNSKAMAD